MNDPKSQVKYNYDPIDPIYDDPLNWPTKNVMLGTDTVCFRVHPSSIVNDDNRPNQPSQSYEEPDIWDDLSDEEDFDLDTNENGEFIHEMQVPKMLYGTIIGFKGAMRRKLEAETECIVKVPLKTDPDGCVVLTGPIPNNVVRCKRRITMLLMDARFKQPFTHLLSIPMNSEMIQANFVQFKEDVLKLGDLRGVDETIFQNPFKLHLTIGTLVIAEDDIIKISNLLLKLKLNILDTLLENIGPLQIRMKGLEYMNDDPTEVDVLYANVKIENDTNSLLQLISDELIDYLVEEDLMYKKYDRVKLHVTVMNTLFRKDKDGSKLNVENDYDKHYNRERETFDASKILRKFSDYDFGVQKFNEIHLSIRKTTANRTGYYKAAYVQEF